MSDDLVFWPDGSWCWRHELPEMTHMSDDYEVVGIVESDGALRERAQTQDPYRGLPWMTQEQLLNISGLQLVLVETQVKDLLGVAAACVAAGKHVHLDKPAGDVLPPYRRLLDEAARKKLLVRRARRSASPAIASTIPPAAIA